MKKLLKTIAYSDTFLFICISIDLCSSDTVTRSTNDVPRSLEKGACAYNLRSVLVTQHIKFILAMSHSTYKHLRERVYVCFFELIL